MKLCAPIFFLLSDFVCTVISPGFLWGGEEHKEGLSGVKNVTIPGFEENGRLSWKLSANEVNFMGEGLYEASDLTLETMTGFNQSNARSSNGLFKPKSGEANGDSLLTVEGKGFSAEGEQWIWRERTDEGQHLMAFKENGKVLFEEDLNLGITSSDRKISPDKKFSTFAVAEYIELLELSKESNRFLLRGKVSISSEEMKIQCEEMELLFEKDQNQSSLGKISKVFAKSAVELEQPGRKSFCDSLTIDSMDGEAVLEGNARVEDNEWGVVRGERILLQKGTRRAQVMGSEGNRPRIELPSLPSLGFPLGRKKEEDE